METFHKVLREIGYETLVCGCVCVYRLCNMWHLISQAADFLRHLWKVTCNIYVGKVKQMIWLVQKEVDPRRFQVNEVNFVTTRRSPKTSWMLIKCCWASLRPLFVTSKLTSLTLKCPASTTLEPPYTWEFVISHLGHFFLGGLNYT